MLTYKEIREEYDLLFDGDKWGNAMHWLFTIADYLYFEYGYTPSEWEYRPSPLGPSNDNDDIVTGIMHESHPQDLTRFGNVLFRYTRLLDRAGMSY